MNDTLVAAQAESHVRPEIHPYQWIAGTTSKIKYRVVNPSGDWRLYVSRGEQQNNPHSPGKDRSNCLNHSLDNAEEIQVNYFGKNGMLPATHDRFLFEDGYYNENGELDLCERFNAILDGTSPNGGNWFWKVGDGWISHGVIPQRMLTEDPNLTNYQYYYTEGTITVPMLEQGKKSKQYFNRAYELLPDTKAETLKYHLKQAPLWIHVPGHAEVLILCNDDVDKFLVDSYAPFIKSYAPALILAYKAVVEVKQLMKEVIALKDTLDQYLVEGTEKHKIPDLDTESFLREKIKIITGFVRTVEQEEFDSFVTGLPMPSVAADNANRAIYNFYKDKLPILQDAYETK